MRTRSSETTERSRGGHIVWNILLAIAWIALTLLPTRDLWVAELPQGHDAAHHAFRTMAVADLWDAHGLIPRWSPTLAGGLGYPVFIYCAWLPAAISAAIAALLDVPAVLATNGTLVFAALLLAGGAWATGRELGGKAGAWTCWALVAFAPYHFANLYVRYALAEVMGMAFALWMVTGVLRTARSGARRDAMLACGATALLLLTHSIGSYLFIPFATGAGLLAAALAPEHRPALARVALAVGHGVAIAAVFWLPLLVLREEVMLERGFASVHRYDAHFVVPHQLISPQWGYGRSIAGPEDGMSFQIGLVQIGIMGLALLACADLRWRRTSPAWLATVLLTGTAAGAAWLTTTHSAWLWAMLPPLRLVQMPWRLLMLVVICTGMAGALLTGRYLPALALRHPDQRLYTLLPRLAPVLIIAACLRLTLSYAHTDRLSALSDEQMRTRLATSYVTTTAADEYRPARATAHGLTAGEGEGAPASGRRFLLNGRELPDSAPAPAGNSLLKVEVTATDSAVLTFPVFYFPGWKAEVDGRPVAVTAAGGSGLLQAAIPAGRHRVSAWWEPVPIQRIAAWASLFALMSFAGVIACWRRFASCSIRTRSTYATEPSGEMVTQ